MIDEQTAKNWAMRKFSEMCPQAIPMAGGHKPKVSKFGGDTLVVEIEHSHNDEKSGMHVFTYPVKNDQAEADSKASCERGYAKG